MFKKRNVIAILATLFLGLNILTPAYAAQTNTNKENFFSQMVTFISQKLGLDKTQVQNAVTQFKQQKQSENQQNMINREKARFDKLVKDGKITQAQEDLILKELAALRAKYNSTNRKGMTAELKTWAQANGIDFSLLVPGFAVRPSGMPRPTGPRPTGMNGKGFGFGRRGRN